MRRTIVSVTLAAGLGAVLWLACGLLSFAVAWSSSRWTLAVELLVAPTVQPSSWLQPAPWGVLVPVLGALLLAGLSALAFAGLVAWRGWREAATGVRLLSAWLALVVVGLLTAAVWTLGATLTITGPNGLEWAFRSTQPDLLAAGLFGVVWGWAPALVIARAGGPRGVTAGRVRWVLALAAVLVLVAGVGVVAGQPAAARAGRIAAGGTPDGLPTSTPTPTPTPTPAPPAPVSDEPVQPGADWCGPEATSLTVSGVEAALGHRAVTLVLVNRSSQPCVVDGYPDVALADPDGNALRVDVMHGSSYLAADPGPAAITLAPGAALAATLSWDGTGRGVASARTLWAAPYAGAMRAQLAVAADVGDGTTLTVTAWSTPTD